MKKIIPALLLISFFEIVSAKELENCKWNDKSGTPCVSIFSAPNTSAFK